MPITRTEENGQPVFIIKDQPQLNEATLGALIEFIDGVEDPNYLLNYLANLESNALLYTEDRDRWEKEFEMMQYLRDFLMTIRRNKFPDSSL